MTASLIGVPAGVLAATVASEGCRQQLAKSGSRKCRLQKQRPAAADNCLHVGRHRAGSPLL